MRPRLEGHGPSRVASGTLGDWLGNRADEFDVIVFWRLDRVVRSAADLSKLLNWAKHNGKHLSSVTEEHFDTAYLHQDQLVKDADLRLPRIGALM